MRILLLNQFFPPDPAPTGQLLADVARSLGEKGHEVTVVCSESSYAQTCTGSDFEARGVLVKRIGGRKFGHGVMDRLASYAAYYAGALQHAAFGPPQDAVLTLTTPPLLSLVGTLSKRLRGAKHFIWEMDMYPDIAVALSVFNRGSIVEKIVGLLGDVSRRQANGIVALGPCMRTRLIERGISPDKIVTAENWVDGSLITPRPFPADLPLSVLYSGNLGLSHDIETIAGAMKQLSDSTRFRFVFAGGGPRRAELESFCKAERLENVVFRPYESHSQLASHLGNCHVGLVTQNPATCGAIVPSKTYGLMAAGRPFIFVGPPEATPALNVDRFKCGWQINPGETTSLVDLLNILATHPNMIRAAGERARLAFDHCFDLPQGVRRVTQILCDDEQQLRLGPDVKAHKARS